MESVHTASSSSSGRAQADFCASTSQPVRPTAALIEPESRQTSKPHTGSSHYCFRILIFDTTASPNLGVKSSLRYPLETSVVNDLLTTVRYLPCAACRTSKS